jgi:hypothetical protein
MTFRWIVPVLAAVAAGVLAFGVTRHAVCRAAGPGLDRLQDVSFLRQELNLTNPQLEQIKILHAALATRLEGYCARHCGARARLGQALADETNGVARTESALSDLCSAYEESERAALAHIRRVRALLDATQRERFDQMLTECLCRACPACDIRGKRDVPDLTRCNSGNGTTKDGR